MIGQRGENDEVASMRPYAGLGEAASLPRSPFGDEPGGKERRKLLLVDADHEDRAFVARLLAAAENVEFDIALAGDAEAALSRIAQLGPDVAIVEWDAPGVAKMLAPKLLAGRPPLPFLVLSDRADREIEDAAMALGAADLLDKDNLDAGRLERAVRFAIAKQRAAERLDRLASQDALTGLANRSAFMSRAEVAIASARRRRGYGALALLDLNGFKPVNDLRGHPVGDALLVEVGARLRSIVRETDLVARLGGDEFGVLLDGLARPSDAIAVAHKIAGAIERPFAIDGEPIEVTAGVGVAVFPGDGEDAVSLRAHADAAMYAAKAEGGSTIKFHDPDLDESALAGSRDAVRLSQALRGAGALELRFAPQLRLNDDAWAFRAEPRLLDGQGDPLDGPALRRAAEQAGLVERLTEWLLARVCEQAAAWRRDPSGAQVTIAAPLWSRRALGWGGVADRLAEHLRRLELDPTALELEIDAELLVEDAARGSAALTRLRRLGARLAIADASSPALSLRDLARLPCATARVPVDRFPDPALEPLARLLGELGLRAIATGGAIDLARLRDCGFSAAEAIGVSEPLSPEAALAWMRRAALKGRGASRDE